jgi:FtsH-binding integral membrane protein
MYSDEEKPFVGEENFTYNLIDQKSLRKNFIAKVFGIVGAQLLLTTLIVAYSLNSFPFALF